MNCSGNSSEAISIVPTAAQLTRDRKSNPAAADKTIIWLDIYAQLEPLTSH